MGSEFHSHLDNVNNERELIKVKKNVRLRRNTRIYVNEGKQERERK